MIKLLNYTPLPICSHAIRTCWQSHEKSDNGGPKDQDLIDKVGNKFKHSSTLEHLVYTFYIDGISRALLQELARHRIASLSVKSTRYTLKELETEESFDLSIKGETPNYDWSRVTDFCILTGNIEVDCCIARALENVRVLKAQGISNDIAKFAIPDAYKTELTWTINARSLQNFLSLRTSPAAMWEIRNLAYDIYKSLPEDHKYIFTEYVY